MRQMEIKTWKVGVPKKDESGNPIIEDGQPVMVQTDESMLDALTVLFNNKDPREMPRGLENFRLLNDVSRSFDKARETGVLKLEDTTYTFLKGMIEKDIPCIWGANQDLVDAINEFMELKPIEVS